jgi:hypothetical protein
LPTLMSCAMPCLMLRPMLTELNREETMALVRSMSSVLL